MKSDRDYPFLADDSTYRAQDAADLAAGRRLELLAYRKSNVRARIAADVPLDLASDIPDDWRAQWQHDKTLLVPAPGHPTKTMLTAIIPKRPRKRRA